MNVADILAYRNPGDSGDQWTRTQTAIHAIMHRKHSQKLASSTWRPMTWPPSQGSILLTLLWTSAANLASSFCRVSHTFPMFPSLGVWTDIVYQEMFSDLEAKTLSLISSVTRITLVSRACISGHTSPPCLNPRVFKSTGTGLCRNSPILHLPYKSPRAPPVSKQPEPQCHYHL